MTIEEIHKMYGPALAEKAKNDQDKKKSRDETSSSSLSSPPTFVVHDWRNDVVTIGHVPTEMVMAAKHNTVNKPWPVQLNRLVWSKRKSQQQVTSTNAPCLVLSIGQVVPHEVMGMANYNKNIFVVTGGVDAINLGHFIGGVHGMERMMGRKNNPLSDILNHASEQYLEQELDLWYILTVVGPDPNGGRLCIRGLYIGRDHQAYSAASDLSLQVNFTHLEREPTRIVVYLDPEEFPSTWLGNKATYRTRMAIANQGHLIILAPGVKRFGEDARIDKLIRKYGYKGTPAIMKEMKEEEGRDCKELHDNLSAGAHLIPGSSEGRFKITYCTTHLTKDEVESVGFQ